MQKRVLGRTGEEVSVFGFGGIVVRDTKQKKANNIVAEAVERGVNFFDVGPTYGNAQDILGPALKPYRNDVILACKTEPNLTKKEVKKDIRDSLQALKTDYFDIYQLHAANDPDDIRKALGPEGALEAIVEAKEEGLVRYIGFSSHHEEAAFKLIEQFDFDTVMFPINWNYWLKDKEGEKILELAESRNMGRIAIKTLAHRQWKENEDRDGFGTWYRPIDQNRHLAELALKFTLSRKVNVAVSPGDARMLFLGLDIIEDIEQFGEISEEEIEELKEYGKELRTIYDR